VKTTYLAALAALLALATAVPCSAKPATNGAPPAKAKPAAPRLDILKWPVYQGAELVEQVTLSESQLKAMASKIPAGEQMHLRELKQVTVLTYRLPATVAAKDVIAFYEPRVLGAGYKVFSKDLSDPGDVSTMYAGPKENFLVLSLENEGDSGRTLEIVSIEGPLSSLASLGNVMKKPATPGPKPAPTGP
jgi:hypothetical protein